MNRKSRFLIPAAALSCAVIAVAAVVLSRRYRVADIISDEARCDSNISMVKPFPVSFDTAGPEDGTYPASFTSDDFRWMGGNLTMTVYSEDLYDAVEISLLDSGDTILYSGDTIIVNRIGDRNGFIVINDDIENGGALLQSNGGGTYRAVQMDGHSVYSRLATATVPLSEDFIIVDCGMYPTDPSDTIKDSQKLYLETLEGYRRSFHCLNTRVMIEDGMITCIERKWIP